MKNLRKLTSILIDENKNFGKLTNILINEKKNIENQQIFS